MKVTAARCRLLVTWELVLFVVGVTLLNASCGVDLTSTTSLVATSSGVAEATSTTDKEAPQHQDTQDSSGAANPGSTLATSTTEESGLALFPVTVAGKRGYIDRTGKVVISPQFDNAFSFSEGRAQIVMDRKYGYIDATGKVVVEPQFDQGDPFSDGLALVRDAEGTRYIRPDGSVAFDMALAGAKDFSEGLAAVSIDGQTWGYIDTAGNWMIEPQFSYMAGQFSEGLAAQEGPGGYGFVDKTGTWVIEPYFAGVGDFSEGLASVHRDGDSHGFVDTTGKIVVPLTFHDVGDFSEGLAAATTDDGETWGYIDTSGRWVIAPQSARNWSFSGGLVPIHAEGKAGYMDKQGVYVIEPQFQEAGPFRNGLALVVRDDGSTAYIDQQGAIVWNEMQ